MITIFRAYMSPQPPLHTFVLEQNKAYAEVLQLLTSIPAAINKAVIMTAPPAMKSGNVFTNGVRPKVSKTKSWNQLSPVLSKVAVMARLWGNDKSFTIRTSPK